MARRTHRTWTWTFTKWLLGAGAVGMAGCGRTTHSPADASLASAPNPNQPATPDGGNATSPSERDAALTSDDFSLSTALVETETDTWDPAQTGANFSLPGFGGGAIDAGAPATGLASTTGATSSLPPSPAASDAGAAIGSDGAQSNGGVSTVASEGGVCPACPSSDDPCLSVVCNALNGSCEAEPNVGADCDDDDACTDADQCDPAGHCVGILRTCPASDNACSANVCNPTSGSCEERELPSTSPCDDGDGCTVDDTCDGSGLCHGNERDCSALDDQCLTGACNANSGECEPLPANSGEDCDDDNPCTEDDACDVLGVCGGVAKDCSQYDQACVKGSCNPESGACEPRNVDDGMPCDDLSSCTTNDACQGGVCGGLIPDTCSSGGAVQLTTDTASLVLDTSCAGVGDQFNVATYGGLPLPLPGGPASLGDCSQSSGPDLYLLLDLSSYDSPVQVQATTDHEATLFDTVLILLGADATSDKQCGYNALAACNDDINRDKKQSRIDVVVNPGTYVLVVDGFISNKEGPVGVELTVTAQ